MTTLKPIMTKSRGQRRKSIGIPSWLKPIGPEELDVWRLIKRTDVSNTYNLTLKYRASKSSKDAGSGPGKQRSKTANSTVSRRRRKRADSSVTVSDSDDRASVQSSFTTDLIDLEGYFKDDYDYDAEEPAEPPQYPHLVHVEGNHAQELYLRACPEEPAEPPMYPHLVHVEGNHAQELYLRACREYAIPHSSYFYRSLDGRHTINLCRQRLGPMGVKACAVALVEVLTIHTLNLTDNNIGPKGAEYIAELLKENLFIKHLNLSNNALGGDGVRTLAAVITKTDGLLSLDLSGNGLGEQEAEAVRPLIEDTQNLRVLNLSHNEFREKGGQIIGDAMLWSDTITTLDLSWNHLRRKGAIQIAEALAKNLGLLHLNLSWNGLSLPGSRAVGKALEKNTTLTKLDLSSNRLDRECLEKLLAGLKKNATLKTLKIGQNPLTPEDCLLVLMAIQNNASSALEHLHLKGQMVDQHFVDVLEEMQGQGRQLKVTYGRLRGAEMELHDENEKALLEADPVTVLVEFGRVIGVKLMDLFLALDSDKSKTLSHSEITQGLQALNVPLSDKCVEILIKRLDKDDSGEIDFGELMKGQKNYTNSARSNCGIGSDRGTAKLDQSESMNVRQLLQVILTKKMAGNSKYRRTMDSMTNSIVSDGENKFREKLRTKIQEQFGAVNDAGNKT